MKIKGFDKNLCCRDMQYEVGKEYKTNTTNISEKDLCSARVLHYCDSLINVHEYYCCESDNRYCEIEVLGEEVTDGFKFGSNHIRIVREIIGDELNTLMGKINGNTGLFNTGDRNSGYYNSGKFNSGHRNSGDGNSGNRNSGYFNSGNRNSGDFNSCDNSNGVFCRKEHKIKIFDINSNFTLSEFKNSKYYDAIISSPFNLTEWIEYTDEEKIEDIDKAMVGGYLKEYTYKEACANWWNKMTDNNKKIILSIPNFKKEIFEDITGIKI